MKFSYPRNLVCLFLKITSIFFLAGTAVHKNGRHVHKVIAERKRGKCSGRKAYEISALVQEEKHSVNPAERITGSGTRVRAR